MSVNLPTPTAPTSSSSSELAPELSAVWATRHNEGLHHVYRLFTSEEDFRLNVPCFNKGELLIFAVKTFRSLSLLPKDVVIKWLDLSCSSPMPSIPSFVVTVKHLIYLDVTGCGLTELPVPINNLPNLCVFLASRNKLAVLPNSLTELLQLEVMDIGENPLQDFNLTGFGRLKKLRFLNISFTLVRKLNFAWKDVPTLKVSHEHVFYTHQAPFFLGSSICMSSRDIGTAKLKSLDQAEQYPLALVAMGKQIGSAYWKAKQTGGVSEVKLRVLVIGEASVGKSALISSLDRHLVQGKYLFTEVNKFIKSCVCYYVCSLVVIHCNNSDIHESLFYQLDHAVGHCNIQSIYFIASKIDLFGANSTNTVSTSRSILNLAESWKQERRKTLLSAVAGCTAMIKATAEYKPVNQYLVPQRIELQNKLYVLNNVSFNYIATSAITKEGITLLASEIKKLESHCELYPRSWVEFQQDCVVQLLTSDCQVMFKHALDVVESLQIDSMVKNERNEMAARVLRFLVDTFVVVRETENLFLLGKDGWFDKVLEKLSLENACPRCSRGVLDLICLKRHVKNKPELECFVTVLVHEGMCVETSRSGIDAEILFAEQNNYEKIVQNFLQDDSCLLLPWLLADTGREPFVNIAYENVQEVRPDVVKVIYRGCTRLPFALFHQLCIYLLKVPYTKCLDYWKRGIVVGNLQTTATLNHSHLSTKRGSEISLDFSIAKIYSRRLPSQFWCFVATVIQIIEYKLTEWNWSVCARMWQSDSAHSFFENSNISFSLLDDLCVSDAGSLLVFTCRPRTAFATDLRDSNDIEVRSVFRYSTVTDTETSITKRVEVALDDSAVCDGLPTLSSARVPSRNVSPDPFGVPSKHPEMANEEKRLGSFRRWPRFAPKIFPALATSGFFYSGVRDEVICYHCDVKIGMWKLTDDPDARHLRESPYCEVVKLRTGSMGKEVKANSSVETSALPTYSTPPVPNVAQRENEITSMQSLQLRSDLLHGPRQDLTTESGRLATFENGWLQSCPVDPVDLARSGFYFTGSADSVQCFSCKVALRGWEEGDTADGEHRRHAPYCPFMGRLGGGFSQHFSLPGDVEPHSRRIRLEPQITAYKDQGMQSERERLLSFLSADWLSAVSIRAEDMAAAGLYSVYGEVVRCFHCHVMLGDWVPNDVPIEVHVKSSPQCRFAKAVAQRVHVDKMETSVSATAERMADYDARLASFVNWPTFSPMRPVSLAAAGFYYAGSGDRVRCFSCGGALKDWQPGDRAWNEHGRHFPRCAFFQRNAPSEVAVAVSGYDEPWSDVMSTNSFHAIGKGEVPPWSIATTSSLMEPQVSLMRSEPAHEVERQPGVNQSFLDKADDMGFDRALAERVIATNMQCTGRPYADMNTFIDDVAKAEKERVSSKLESQQSELEPSASGFKRLHKSNQRDPLGSLKELATGLEASSAVSKQRIGAYGEKIKGKDSGISCGSEERRMLSGNEHGSAYGDMSESTAEFCVRTNVQSDPAEMEAETTSSSSGISDLSFTTPQSFATQSMSSESTQDDKLRELHDRRTCKICFDREIAVIFLDCGHLVCCDVCAMRVRDCPICRRPIKSKMRAIFP